MADGAVLKDEGISGTTMERPELHRLREFVRTKAIGAVIVYDPNRLSRNLGHQLLLAEEFERPMYNCSLCRTPWKMALRACSSFKCGDAFAEYERAKTLERTKRGLVGLSQVGAGQWRAGRTGLSLSLRPAPGTTRDR